ncbi:MAG: Gfo/Idh/MocA family oxidoreductase [Oscillospiraceae bacterium]|nr:Gfo/Idh/MocA family oxidoreductase [Oscillospiraceae bacterium]
MLGIAIVGAGAIANVHADAFLKYPELCEIRAVSDLYVEKAQAMIDEKEITGAVAYTEYQDILTRDDIDAVSICLPPGAHAEIAIAALNAGKHVLIEKPMAPSLEECDRIIEAAEQAGRLVSVVAQNRYKTPHYKLKQLLESGTAGKPLHMVVNSLWWRGENYYDIWWRGKWDTEGGGAVTSHAVHHLDLMQWLIGMPKRVTAVITNVAHPNSELEDMGIAIFEYDGMIAQLTTSIAFHGEEQEIIIQTDKGRLSAPWRTAAAKALPNGFPEENVAALSELEAGYANLPDLELEGHPAQVLNFLRAINGEEPLLIDGVQGRRTMELIMAIYKSAATHQPVELPLSPSDPFYVGETMIAQMPRFFEKTHSVENFATSKITLGRDVGK